MRALTGIQIAPEVPGQPEHGSFHNGLSGCLAIEGRPMIVGSLRSGLQILERNRREQRGVVRRSVRLGA